MPAIVGPVSDERDALLSFLAQQRLVLRVAAHGLTDEEARAVPTRSALSVGGLVKHATQMERTWMDMVQQRPRRASRDEYLAGFVMGREQSLASVLADYAESAAETEVVMAAVADLSQPVPVPKGVPWFPADVEAWSVRWVLLHMIQETARHAGHADIIRESLDGAQALPLLAAEERWPETSWLTPWSRSSAALTPAPSFDSMSLSESDLKFLETNHGAAMITVTRSGVAKAARVGVALVDGKVWSSGTEDRARTARLRRDPRCTLFVFDAAFAYLCLETTVRLLEGPDAPALNLRLFRVMQGKASGPINWFGAEYEEEAFVARMAEERRLVYEFEVHRAYGLH